MSLCCLRSAILLIAISLLFQSLSFAGEPPLLISNYLERTSNTKKYACAIFCESARLDSQSSKKDYSEEIWYLHAFDPESNRIDMMSIGNRFFLIQVYQVPGCIELFSF
jgi:hypothetical protein